jgi:hypothetical protein
MAGMTHGEPVRRSPARGIVYASVASLAGAIVSIALVAAAFVTVGLLVVAAVTARFVADALRAGAGNTLGADTRRALAVATALESVVLGWFGIWLLALAEGGALGFIDYLGETFGALVPLQLAVAAIVAWWNSR